MSPGGGTVYASDLKSEVAKASCGFKSRPGYLRSSHPCEHRREGLQHQLQALAPFRDAPHMSGRLARGARRCMEPVPGNGVSVVKPWEYEMMPARAPELARATAHGEHRPSATRHVRDLPRRTCCPRRSGSSRTVADASCHATRDAASHRMRCAELNAPRRALAVSDGAPPPASPRMIPSRVPSDRA